MKYLLLLILGTLLLFTGCADPEFYNCDIEIITLTGDTIKVDSAFVEIESGTWAASLKGSSFGDNFMIIKKDAGEWNITEDEIQSFTLKWINPNGK